MGFSRTTVPAVEAPIMFLLRRRMCPSAACLSQASQAPAPRLRRLTTTASGLPHHLPMATRTKASIRTSHHRRPLWADGRRRPAVLPRRNHRRRRRKTLEDMDAAGPEDFVETATAAAEGAATGVVAGSK